MRYQFDKRGSPEKRPRSPDELEEQAGFFKRDWRTGDRVMTWLNRHEGRLGELSRLVVEGWTWVDVGRAMHSAGIAYRTGEPISAPILRKKASEARTAARAKSAQSLSPPDPQRDAPETPTGQQRAAFPEPMAAALPLAGSEVPIETEEPEFKPATLTGHSWRKPAETPPLPAEHSNPAPSPAIDVASVLARFTNRK
jgi:hypothetical protein